MNDDSVQAIRDRMVRIRARARGKAQVLGQETRQFLDWKHYVKLFPWGALAVAVAVGYLVVPRRASRVPQAPPLDPTLVSQLNRLGVPAYSPPPLKRSGIADRLMQFASSTLLKAGMAFVGQQLTQLLAAPKVPAPSKDGPYEFARYTPRREGA
jgi:hypothetical protein